MPDLKQPKDADIARWCERTFGTRNWDNLGIKLGEEAGEVLGAICKIAEGRSTTASLKDEIGDVLIVLSTMADRLGTDIETLRRNRFRRIVRRATQKPPKPYQPDEKIAGWMKVIGNQRTRKP